MAGLAVENEVSTAEAVNRRGAWMANTFEAFQAPVYRIVWLGTILAFMGFNISMTAQAVVAYDLTGSNRAVGTVLFGQGLAMLFLNPFGGAIADRFSKRMLMLLAQTVIGVVALTLAILIVTDLISIPILAIAAFTVGSMFSFLGPTRMALVSEHIPSDRIGNAMALIQVGGNFSRIAGPFIAGAMLATPWFGSAGTYFFVAGVFVFVIATLWRIPPTPVRPNPDRTSVLTDVRLGFQHVISNPRLLHAVLSFHIVTVLGMSYIVLIPGFSKGVLDAGTSGVGLLLGVSALGGLFTTVFVAGIANARKAPNYLPVFAIIFGCSLILTGLAPSLPLALAAMVLVGAGGGGYMALNNAVALRYTHPDFIGRVVGLIFLAWGMNSLFTLPVGFVADQLGERTVLAGMGALLCGVTVLLALWAQRIEATNEEWQPYTDTRLSTEIV